MFTIRNLPVLEIPVPTLNYKAFKGGVDNGIFSNMHKCSRNIVYRDVSSPYVEVAYVAAKNPDYQVNETSGEPPKLFSSLVNEVGQISPYKAKSLGSRKSGILLSTREDWEDIQVAAMFVFLCQKFSPGTEELSVLLNRPNEALIEWNNWRDIKWGLAFTDKNGLAYGHNALVLLLIAIKNARLLNHEIKIPDESEWATLQDGLIPYMRTISKKIFGHHIRHDGDGWWDGSQMRDWEQYDAEKLVTTAVKM